MVSLVLTFSVAFVAALALTAVVRLLARRWGILDYPDGKRKLHPHSMPLWGGLAVYVALCLALAAARLGSFGVGEQLDELAIAIVAAAGFVCFFGCVDDSCHLRPRVKLLLQTCAVLPIVLAGFYADRISLFGRPFELDWLGIPLTVLWLVGCINAMNLLDGMDGLASIVGISTAVMIGVIATIMGNEYVTVVAIALAGALGGFLVHNLPPARIFLGDSGSMVIGLVVGLLGVQSTLKSSATLSITVPLVVMTFPMFDTVLAVVRRKLTGRRFDAADRQHIHHRLLDRGMNPWVVLGIIGALCLGTGVATTIAILIHREAVAWITALVLMVLVIRLRLFGHYELSLLVGSLARLLAALANRLASPFPARLPGAEELSELAPSDVWAILVQRVRPWKVGQLQIVLSSDPDCRWREVWIDSQPGLEIDCAWSLAVTMHADTGRSCELRAAGFDALGPEFACPTGLACLLRLFAAYFAEHTEMPPGQPELRIGPTGHPRRRAA